MNPSPLVRRKRQIDSSAVETPLRSATSPRNATSTGTARAWAGLAQSFRALPIWIQRLAQVVVLFVGYYLFSRPLAGNMWDHLSGGLIGGGDATVNAWGFWWTRFTLEHGRWPLVTDYMFHPQVLGATALTPLVSYNGLISWPLQAFIGLEAASNLMVLVGFLLSAVATFFLVRYETGNNLAAIIGGIVYAFAPPVFARLDNGQFSVTSIWQAPITALAWLIMLRTGSARAAIVAGAFFAFQASVNPYNASYLTILMAVMLLCVMWGFWRTEGHGIVIARQLARNVAITLLAFSIVFAPHFIGIIGDLRTEDTARVSLQDVQSFGPDLLSYVVPSPLQSLFADTLGPINQRLGSVDRVRVVFPGYLALILGIIGLIFGLRDSVIRRKTATWGLGCLTLFFVSLGPGLHLNGQVQQGVPMPFLLLYHVPIVGEGRTTANAVFMVSLSLAVLGGIALSKLFKRINSFQVCSLIVAVLVAILLVEYGHTPIPVVDYPISPFYQQIAAEPGDFAVMELPLGFRDGRRGLGELQVERLLDATVDEKPMINGYVSRAPDRDFDFYSNKPELSFFLNAAQTPKPEAQDPARVFSTLRQFGVRYLIVHNFQYTNQMNTYVTGTLKLQPIYHDTLLTAYRLN